MVMGRELLKGAFPFTGLRLPTERVSAARMAAVKPQGWVHASLGVGDLSPASTADMTINRITHTDHKGQRS